MLEWIPERIDRLFELYGQHFARLRQNVIATNLSLGSSNPEKTRLERLTRSEFEAILTDTAIDREAIHMWVLRIIRGHEDEFPIRQAAG